MPYEIQYYGIYEGQLLKRVDEWYVSELWFEDMGKRTNKDTVFEVTHDPEYVWLTHVTITDLYGGGKWEFRLNLNPKGFENSPF